MSHQYFLGIDVGATKTAALIADETGTALGYGLGGPGNHESVGWDGFKQASDDAVKQALAQAGVTITEIAAAGMGLAGLDWDNEYEIHTSALAEIGLTMPMFLDNDSALGLYAGASQGWGVCVAAGSSNNARGRGKDGRLGRITGHGSEFGEYGGAWEIIHHAIQKVAYEWSKRLPPTAMSPIFIADTGARNLADLVEGLALRRYEPKGYWAIRVFECAAAGDKAARDVITWAGHELGETACAIIRQIEAENEPVEVILTGSVYKGGELIINPLREVVLATAPRAKFIVVDAPPVVGGVLMGMELILGKDAYKTRAHLLETARALSVSSGE